MTDTAPETTLDERFSSEGATALPWAEGVDRLTAAGTYWLSTVRADGRPHVTPLLAVWSAGALHFCTGPGEQKAKNLANNANCALTTGTESADAGLDVIVEGEAIRVHDGERLHELAAAWETKYGPDWHFDVDVEGGAFVNPGGGPAYVFAVTPRVAFGFAKGEPFGQTRWRFHNS
jgi:hypothetical protein